MRSITFTNAYSICIGITNEGLFNDNKNVFVSTNKEKIWKCDGILSELPMKRMLHSFSK